MGKNTQKRPEPRPGQKSAASSRQRPAPAAAAPNRLWLWIAIGAIVAVVAGIAVWSASGGDETVSEGTAAPDGQSSSPGEVQPVTVVGAALSQFELGADPNIGSPAPELDGFTFDGSPVSIRPGSDGPMMLVFLAHWCPHCNREVPVLNEWRDQGGIPDDLQIIGITTGVDANAPNYPPSEWIDDVEWTWPVLADSAAQDAALAYGLRGYPYFVIVGEDGTVRARGSGEKSIAELDQLVDAALGG